MIYLDNSATTKPFKSVIEKINDANLNHWYNASGTNTFSTIEMQHINQVKAIIADDLNCSYDEIYFTGSGCEANTMAILGFLSNKNNYSFYTSKMEHSSINMICDFLNKQKIKINYLRNDKLGNIKYEDLSFCTNPFVSISAANSEIGVIQNIQNISKLVHKNKGILHCDAVQLFPEQKIDVKKLNIDLLSISAQKFHGPKGIGILYIKNGLDISPIIYGTQENNLRGGTYNNPLIYGLEEALIQTRSTDSNNQIKTLRDKLLFNLLKISDTYLNGPGIDDNRLVNNISITIKGVDAEVLTFLCNQMNIIIAKGSACQSHINMPSRTLKAIGLSDEDAKSTIRITLDCFNTENEIDIVSNIITKLVDRIRNN